MSVLHMQIASLHSNSLFYRRFAQNCKCTTQSFSRLQNSLWRIKLQFKMLVLTLWSASPCFCSRVGRFLSGRMISNFDSRLQKWVFTWREPTNITLVPFFHSWVESPSPSTWKIVQLVFWTKNVWTKVSRLFVKIILKNLPNPFGCTIFAINP